MNALEELKREKDEIESAIRPQLERCERLTKAIAVLEGNVTDASISVPRGEAKLTIPAKELVLEAARSLNVKHSNNGTALVVFDHKALIQEILRLHGQPYMIKVRPVISTICNKLVTLNKFTRVPNGYSIVK